MKNILILVLVLSVISGCGFKPLYGDNESSTEKLGAIKINVTTTGDIPEKFVHLLQKAIEGNFNSEQGSRNKTHALTVSVVKALASYETQNNTSTRTRITLYVNLALLDLNTNKKIYEDKLIAVDSFQVADSPYSALVSEEETAIRMTKEIANEIELRVLRRLGVGR